ncbi:MAG: tripartite tricarboxylate transporter TctB family protein [Propionibacteriales bacterium]|nr:tripartite tricarboxylate transporter TctB family protein [Propionibacteriales bacterium]
MSADDSTEALMAELLVEEDKAPAGGPWYTRLSAIVTFGVGAFVVLTSVGLGLGEVSEPGPGMWPLVLGIAVMVLSVVLLVRGHVFTDTEKFSKSTLLPLIGVATLVAFWVLLPMIGFEIPAALLVFSWLRWLGRESWRVSIIGTVLTVAAFYLVFVTALGVPIPRLI